MNQWITRRQCRLDEMVCRAAEEQRAERKENGLLWQCSVRLDCVFFFFLLLAQRYELNWKRERKQRAQGRLRLRDRSYLNTSGEAITWLTKPAQEAAMAANARQRPQAALENWEGPPDARIFGRLHWAHWWTLFAYSSTPARM
jgi:hypothetical protein